MKCDATDATDEKTGETSVVAVDDVKTPPSVDTLTTEESAARNATTTVTKKGSHEQRRDERRGAPTCSG